MTLFIINEANEAIQKVARVAQAKETVFQGIQRKTLEKLDKSILEIEGRYGDDVANFERGGSRRANFAEQPRRDIKSGLFGVTLFTGGGVFGLLGREADLDSVITVFFDSFNLDHWAGSGFNDGDGD